MAMTSLVLRYRWQQRAAAILCGVIGTTGALAQWWPPVAGASAPTALNRPIDPNHDPAWILAELPRIGTQRAQAIVEWRQVSPRTPAFCTPADLQHVPGIGPGTVDVITPLVSCQLQPGLNWTQ